MKDVQMFFFEVILHVLFYINADFLFFLQNSTPYSFGVEKCGIN